MTTSRLNIITNDIATDRCQPQNASNISTKLTPNLNRRTFLLAGLALVMGRPGTSVRAAEPTPYFLQYNPIWNGVDINRDPNPIEAKFGMPVAQMDDLIRAVLRRIPGIGLHPGRNVQALAKAIQHEVDTVLQTADRELNDFSRQWLLAEGVCRWVFLNVYYDFRQIGPDGIAINFAKLGQSTAVLAANPPVAVCGGFACVIRDIARACGLKSYKVDGHYRDLGYTGPIGQNHSIACFEFSNGFKVPADLANTSYRSFSQTGVRVDKKVPPVRLNHAWTLPRSAEAWEIFLARFCTWDGIINGQQIVNWDGDLQGVHRFTSLSFNQWQQRNTEALKPILQWLWHVQDMDIEEFGQE